MNIVGTFFNNISLDIKCIFKSGNIVVSTITPNKLNPNDIQCLHTDRGDAKKTEKDQKYE